MAEKWHDLDFSDFVDSDDYRESYDPEDDEEKIQGWCSDCKNECSSTTIDEGIGYYEYGSIKGVNHDYQMVSDCCEAEILMCDPNDVEEEEVQNENV